MTRGTRGTTSPAPGGDRLAAVIEATQDWRDLERGRDALPSLVAALQNILAVPGGALVFAAAAESGAPKLWGAWGPLDRDPKDWWPSEALGLRESAQPLRTWIEPPPDWTWAAGAAAAGIWPFTSQEDWGALLLTRTQPRTAWPDDSDTFRGLAAYLSLVLDLIRQRRAAESLSHHDVLTGLLNRLGLQEAWRERLAAARRHQHALVVVVADVDHLKEINDREGHLAGDRVLRRAAEALRRLLRGDDAVGRWGGDEFVGILTVKEPHADAVARRVRDGLLAGGVSAGVGAAVLGVDGHNWAECFEVADRRCYAMKTWR